MAEVAETEVEPSKINIPRSVIERQKTKQVMDPWIAFQKQQYEKAAALARASKKRK